jgi:hypothetical protein
VNTGLFWRALGVQTAAVGVLFAILVLALPHDFFDDFGFVVGPLAWIGCTLVTARVLSLPIPFALFAALAGGVAGTIVLVVANHWAGLVVMLLVFAASCAGFESGAAAGPEGTSGSQ